MDKNHIICGSSKPANHKKDWVRKWQIRKFAICQIIEVSKFADLRFRNLFAYRSRLQESKRGCGGQRTGQEM
jgi:hypothetical protein